MNNQNERQTFLKNHKGFSQIFSEGKLTFGLVAPMVGYPNSPIPDMTIFDQTVKQADEGGLDAIWLRDVPFYDPSFGDLGQVYDPMAYAGYLAATTKRIIIGTAGIVLPLRDPITVAKQATTIDHLSKGRFILGLASGDRPSEYPAFDCNFDNRPERFREARDIIKKLTEESFPNFKTENYGEFNGSLDLVPKPLNQILPTISIGRAGQKLEWISEYTDGWIWHGESARNVPLRIKQLREVSNGQFKPYGYSNFLEIEENPNAPVRTQGNFTIGGRNNLIDFWQKQQEEGLSHLALNPKPSRRDPVELIQEITEFILPQFK